MGLRCCWTPLREMISGCRGVQLADGNRMLPALARPGGQGRAAPGGAAPGRVSQIKRMFGVYGAGVRERTAIGGVCWTTPTGPGGAGYRARLATKRSENDKITHLAGTISC
ncbi:MAG: hypothetical protein ACLRPX_11250 [Ruthenibacterium sp.]